MRSRAYGSVVVWAQMSSGLYDTSKFAHRILSS